MVDSHVGQCLKVVCSQVHMQAAMAAARDSAAAGGISIGAALVLDGEIIATG